MGTLMTMAIGILIALVRRRARVWGYVGGALALVGIYFNGAVVGYSLVQAPLVDSAYPIRTSSPSPTPHVRAPGLQRHPAAVPRLLLRDGLLAVALRRARVVPLWVAAVIAAAP
jgi:hypothetical protein